MWQPIETAPKDGAWFIVCYLTNDGWSYETGRYNPLTFADYVELSNGLYRKEEKEVYQWEGFNNFSRANHWMPLPEPPETNND